VSVPRVLVCGGRDFNDGPLLHRALSKLCFDRKWITGEIDDNWMPNILIIHGCARGADSHAGDWAHANFLQWLAFPADWKTHGRLAGYIRNKQMLDEGKPDLVVAFPGGRGTAMMVKIAREAGVEVIEVLP